MSDSLQPQWTTAHQQHRLRMCYNPAHLHCPRDCCYQASVTCHLVRVTKTQSGKGYSRLLQMRKLRLRMLHDSPPGVASYKDKTHIPTPALLPSLHPLVGNGFTSLASQSEALILNRLSMGRSGLHGSQAQVMDALEIGELWALCWVCHWVTGQGVGPPSILWTVLTQDECVVLCYFLQDQKEKKWHAVSRITELSWYQPRSHHPCHNVITWVCVYVYAKLLQSCPTLCNPWTVSCQTPQAMGFSRQGYWSGLPFPPPGDLPDLGIKLAYPVSPALAGGFFTTSSTWEIPKGVTWSQWK